MQIRIGGARVVEEKPALVECDEGDVAGGDGIGGDDPRSTHADDVGKAEIDFCLFDIDAAGGAEPAVGLVGDVV